MRTRRPARGAALAFCTALLAAAHAHAGVRAIWALSDGDKVAIDDRTHALRARNEVWDGRGLRLLAARNEIVAFQVVVEADEKGLGAVSVSLPFLARGESRIAYAPPAADPSLSVGRPIQLFSVRSMKVTEESRAEWVWKPGSPAAPRKTVGFQPVQLVPENARAGRGGFPLRLDAHAVQAFWVEIDTGRGRPAGDYTGSVRVEADGQTRELPVTLRLLDFDLPDRNSLDVMVYYEPSQPELYQGRNLDPAYHRFAHRHRVELVHAYDEPAVLARPGRFSGEDFSAVSGYEGPGQGVGNRIVPLSFYGPGRDFREKDSAWPRADAWMSFVSAHLKGVRTFLYLPDEPYLAQYAEVRGYAERVRSNPGPGGKLPLFLTKRIIPEFQGLVDLWSIPPQALDLAQAAAERSRGRQVSFYNHGRPQGPALLIDAPATEARVVAWAAFKHDIDLYFFWHGVHWQHNSQKQGERKQNVWANPITFDNRGQPRKPVEDQGYINGDGVLLYPGEEKVHPEEDRGLSGPVGTVQLANLRRGLQDHQYLTLARALGLEREVKEALDAVVPRVFSDAGKSVSFPESGELIELQRRRLGEAIEARRKQARPSPPASPLPSRPRVLLAERDPFSGLPSLRARWAKGERPSDDLPGKALSYLLSGDESFARGAVDEMRRAALPRRTPSRDFRTYAEWAMAFDWLYASPAFDAALKDRIAGDLLARAEQILDLPSLRDPAQASYHNHTLRELALASFALAAVAEHPSVEERGRALRERAARAYDNVLELTELVNPDGGYHESTDYMRITWEPLAMLAELRRTMAGDDPAHRYGVFRNMGTTYLYKALPDGSMARDDDNEYPHLDGRDSLVLGYAVHRFKDPYAAFLLRESGWLPEKWSTPILQFLWRDDGVLPRDPARTAEAELPRRRLFRGISHLVLRNGFGPDATWIQLSAGPHLAKHDHLDWGHFAIYRRGHLAIDAGADYTDTESPHYLNHYRRTVAHNTLLVYRKGERFFWGENRWEAANDGGQRMDSARFWNTVRSLEDWRRTRDLWDRGSLESLESAPGEYDYARGEGARAYQPSKLERFARELLYLPRADVVFLLDRVRVGSESDRKVWLLHGVSAPQVEGTARGIGQGGTSYGASSRFQFTDGGGRLVVHPILPVERDVVARGGPGFEFWTPGDEFGGDWGSGRNWPLEPPEGGPLPADPYLKKMWLTFWGEEMKALSPSNRRSVVPGSWRIEISPARAARDDVFLNVLEIGDQGATPKEIQPVLGYGLAGAAVGGDALVLAATRDEIESAEASVPDLATQALILTGLAPRALYEVQTTSAGAPGSPAFSTSAEASAAGLIHVRWKERDGRLRVRRLRR